MRDGDGTSVGEAVVSPPLDALFPSLAHSPACVLPEGQATVRGLLALGRAMAVQPDEAPARDSRIPSFFTYFGQLIDHDLTVRSGPAAMFRTGARPRLDLAGVYGDGPGRDPAAGSGDDALYDGDHKFRLQRIGNNGLGASDLWRERTPQKPNPRTALIADPRNDENIVISQLHAAFLGLHNAIMDGIAVADPGIGKDKAFVRARQLVRWVYQYLVVEHYLRAICLDGVLDDVLRNGQRLFRPVAGGEAPSVPLEFSAAVFRLGPAMMRGAYRLRDATLPLSNILGVSRATRPRGEAPLFDVVGGRYVLRNQFTVEWSAFVRPDGANKARRIDPLIARGLPQMPALAGADSFMAHFAMRTLLRGHALGIPTGQAVAARLGVEALDPGALRDGEEAGLRKVLDDTGFARRTPLWYYVLREAALVGAGSRLGVVGSRIVAETIVGLLAADPESYLRQSGKAPGVGQDGIVVPLGKGRKRIGSVGGFLGAAGVHAEGIAELDDRPEEAGSFGRG
ncbi:MAG: hypothetical protein J0H08_14835 [Rhizobiales bacterium]|nr:hypothetical protein [Hyphomicrobiales bacterium]